MGTQTVFLKDRKGQARNVLIDLADVPALQHYTWRVCPCGYVHRKYGNEFIYLHRVLMGAKHGQYVDHINGDTLDNRRANLRLCTPSQNVKNQGISKRNTSGFKGVSATGGKWRAAIGHHGTLHYLGVFDDPRAAAHAYNRAAVQFHGDFARLNPL